MLGDAPVVEAEGGLDVVDHRPARAREGVAGDPAGGPGVRHRPRARRARPADPRRGRSASATCRPPRRRSARRRRGRGSGRPAHTASPSPRRRGDSSPRRDRGSARRCRPCANAIRWPPAGQHASILRPLGAWRSLVARTVRVGEVPGSNPGAPITAASDPAGVRGRRWHRANRQDRPRLPAQPSTLNFRTAGVASAMPVGPIAWTLRTCLPGRSLPRARRASCMP